MTKMVKITEGVKLPKTINTIMAGGIKRGGMMSLSSPTKRVYLMHSSHALTAKHGDEFMIMCPVSHKLVKVIFQESDQRKDLIYLTTADSPGLVIEDWQHKMSYDKAFKHLRGEYAAGMSRQELHDLLISRKFTFC